jgi:hypothetical protein
MLTDETLVTLTEATRHIPCREGKRLHSSTIWRWHAKGVRTRSGRRVRLEALRLGGRVWTSVQAIERFGIELAEANMIDGEQDSLRAPRPRTPSEAQRAAEIARAAAECEDAGI